MVLKRQLPMMIVFVVGILMIVQFYIPHPISGTMLEEANRWQRIIRNCALLLGVISLINYHWRKVERRQPGFGYSLIVFLAFIPMVVFGLWKGIDAPRRLDIRVEIPAEALQRGGTYETSLTLYQLETVTLRPAEGETPLPIRLQGYLQNRRSETEPLPLTLEEPIRFGARGNLTLVLSQPLPDRREDYELIASVVGDQTLGFWMFQNLKVPMESTMFSLLAFFISSAAFRAFRARSLDATIMLVAALVVMVGRVSFGDTISAWFSDSFLIFPETTKWLLEVPSTAAKRAIFLGISLSMIATSVRIIFGIERTYLGKGD